MNNPYRILLSRLIFPAVLMIVVLLLNTNFIKRLLFTGDEADTFLSAALLFVLAFFIIRLGDAILRSIYARRGKAFPLPKVLHTIILIILYLTAFFIILRGILNVSITPFLATSALLTMIVGLAFQGVLSNILSGVSLHFTKSFNKGDWVKVGDDEGVVMDTNWRETRIFDRFSNIIVIPNNTMASEMITNFSYPNKKTALTIPVMVSYAAAPLEVFLALREAALDVPEVVDRPEPEAHLLGYENLGMSYAVKFWITDFAQKYQILAEVGKNIWYKFKRRNIEIPVAFQDQLLGVMGSVRSIHGLTEAKDPLDRMVLSLMNSDFLRDTTEHGDGQLMVPEEEIRNLVESVQCFRYAPGEIVFRQGDKGDHCYFVVKGGLKGIIVYEEKGKKYTSEFRVAENNLFGEMSLFTGMPRTATGIVDCESELLEIKAEDFALLLERNPRVAEVIAETVSRRNQDNQEFLEKIKELSENDIRNSTNKSSILNRFKSLIKGVRPS